MNVERARNSIFTQFATVNSLLVGLYNGFFSVKDICSHGNFGLGCPDAMEGEMLINEGECYVAPAGVPPRKMGEQETVAFAQVTHFTPSSVREISNVLDKDTLSQLLLDEAKTSNLFIGFRVSGLFRTLKIRQPPSKLSQPYPPLVEALKNQKEIQHSNIRGIALGFWSPTQYQGTSVAGIHIHFLAEDKSCGGHIMEIDIESGLLEMQLYSRFDLHLPSEPIFLNSDQHYENADQHIRTAEG